MADRYFLTEEREVTKAEYVAAERANGLRNIGNPDEPAASYWSAGRMSGRIVYGPYPSGGGSDE